MPSILRVWRLLRTALLVVVAALLTMPSAAALPTIIAIPVVHEILDAVPQDPSRDPLERAGPIVDLVPPVTVPNRVVVSEHHAISSKALACSTRLTCGAPVATIQVNATGHVTPFASSTHGGGMVGWSVFAVATAGSVSFFVGPMGGPPPPPPCGTTCGPGEIIDWARGIIGRPPV